MKYIVIIVLFVSCMLLSYNLPHISHAEISKISIGQILEIANSKAEDLGYNIETQQIELFYNIIPREMKFPETKTPDYLIPDSWKKLKEKLKGREFWAVYYSYPFNPDNISFGGDMTIYIDANTGEVIEVYRTA